MELQYISDEAGNHTAVIIPIAEWNNITAKHEDLKELTEEPKKENKKKPSDFAGTLTNEEAEKFHKYLKQARSEWDRNI
jgi:hypothetical protein